ncbi:hypothetical protein AAG570_003097 [Ranatra chinensis]|uniref:Uncharacterized protein n=1 Tax=Ranatra chinensis TaxID=642074 RepID=A0ABD0Y5W6_9HEMI
MASKRRKQKTTEIVTYGLCAERAARYKGTLGGGGRGCGRGGGGKDGTGAGGGGGFAGGIRQDGMGGGGGAGGGASGPAGGASHRGSLLTTLTSFDCATRQASLTAVHEQQPQQLQLDTMALPNQLRQQFAEGGRICNTSSL